MDEDRAREGIEHLQAAAREMIAAARALLDVAETLVEDPAAAATIVAAVGSVAKAAMQGFAGGDRSAPTGPAERVERIKVS
jgi:hypothetical protein